MRSIGLGQSWDLEHIDLEVARSAPGARSAKLGGTIHYLSRTSTGLAGHSPFRPKPRSAIGNPVPVREGWGKVSSSLGDHAPVSLHAASRSICSKSWKHKSKARRLRLRSACSDHDVNNGCIIILMILVIFFVLMVSTSLYNYYFISMYTQISSPSSLSSFSWNTSDQSELCINN